MTKNRLCIIRCCNIYLYSWNCLVFTPLSTIFLLYQGISWVSYQYYWSIYSNISWSVVMLTPKFWESRRAAITSMFKVFGVTGRESDPQPSATTSLRRLSFITVQDQVIADEEYFHNKSGKISNNCFHFFLAVFQSDFHQQAQKTLLVNFK